MKITRSKDGVIIDGEGLHMKAPISVVTIPEDDPNPLHLKINGFYFGIVDCWRTRLLIRIKRFFF